MLLPGAEAAVTDDVPVTVPALPIAHAKCELGPQNNYKYTVGQGEQLLLDGIADSGHADLIMPALEAAYAALGGQHLGDLCLIDTPLETLILALNEASEGEFALVYVGYEQFHPDVIKVKSGAPVLFWAPDPQEYTPNLGGLSLNNNAKHNVLSTGPCADAGVDAATHPRDCKPIYLNEKDLCVWTRAVNATNQNPAVCPPQGISDTARKCFDSEADMGGNLNEGNLFPPDSRATYPLTLRYDAATGQIEKGIYGYQSSLAYQTLVEWGLVEDPHAFRACASNTGVPQSDGSIVIPYHCHFHGIRDGGVVNVGGPVLRYGRMRGTIIVEPRDAPDAAAVRQVTAGVAPVGS